jgi:hypothetical protein
MSEDLIGAALPERRALRLDPLGTRRLIRWVERLGCAPDITDGVIPVKNLNGASEEFLCTLPEPRRTVTDKDHLLRGFQPAPVCFQPERLGKGWA